MSSHSRTWIVSSSVPLSPRKARLQLAEALSINPFLLGFRAAVSRGDSRLFFLDLDSYISPGSSEHLHFHETDSKLAELFLREAYRFESLVSAFFDQDTPTAFYLGRPLLLSAEVSRNQCVLIEFTSRAWELYRIPDQLTRSFAFDSYKTAQNWLCSVANHLKIPITSTPGCVLSMAAGGSLSP